MNILQEVDYYISQNVLHSEPWEKATAIQRNKVVNQSINVLSKEFNKDYKNLDYVDQISYQAIWILKIDDSIQRAELGVSYLMVDGVAMNFKDVDRAIAPYVKRVNGQYKRKVGSYAPTNTNNTFRKGW